MFKVSFKDDFKKVETFNDRATVVTLVGKCELPKDFYSTISVKIANWIWDHPSVDVQWVGVGHTLRLEVSGKSVCSSDDTFDPAKGSHIAESRAKIKLYKFMRTLCSMLIRHYSTIVAGDGNPVFAYSSDNPCIISSFMKYQNLLDREEAHLNSLLDEV